MRRRSSALKLSSAGAGGRLARRLWRVSPLLWLGAAGLAPAMAGRATGEQAASGLVPSVASVARRSPVPALLNFSAVERRRIGQHGPWPPPTARDAGNALAGNAAAVALGQRLFFDARLSADGRLACASCHHPAQGFADGLPRGVARSVLARNTPSLWNAVHER